MLHDEDDFTPIMLAFRKIEEADGVLVAVAIPFRVYERVE